MKLTPKTLRAAAFALALPALAAGCDSALNVEAMGDAQVSLQRLTTPALWSHDSSGALISLPQDTVASLTVTVTSIQFLRAGEPDTNDGDGWVSLTLDAPVTIDLMALPSDGDSPIVIAAGQVAVGAYGKVRFFVTDPTIQFTGDVHFGLAGVLTGGVDYAVTIPSGDQTGIKTSVSFTVVADDEGVVADVGLLFDGATTLSNLIVTGNGTVMMSPVLRARAQPAS